jgi:hypothetical protein
MSRPTVIVAHCPQCNGDRATDIVAEYSETYNSETYDSNTLYRVLKCKGCSHIQFQTASTNSEDFDYDYDEAGEPVSIYHETIKYFPPLDKRPRPDYTRTNKAYSATMERLLDEAYDALKYDLHVVAAIALRTVFDAATEVLGIDTALTFKQKLDKLLADGRIDTFQQGVLDALTDAGSAAAHRGWQPTEQELDTMFTIMEGFLYRVFVTSLEQKELAKRAAALKKRTPRRQKRKAP